MQSIRVAVPDTVALQVSQLVQEGWLASEQELLRAAVLDFVRHNRFELMERFQREDIAWALRQKVNRQDGP